MIWAIVGGVLIVLAAMILIFAVILLLRKQKPQIEIKNDDVVLMAAYIKAQKEQAEAVAVAKQEKKDFMKQQLDVYKQTKEQLKEELRVRFDGKEWRPLESILKSADKGVVGVYILYNQTKNKYYIGQAKQILKRIRDHFEVEDVARDFLNGDKIQVKFLTASELGSDYRLDHIEKTGIEIFDAGKTGYNKTQGNKF